MSLDYHTVLTRLEAIERDLAERQLGYERAAEDLHRTKRDYELRLATVKQTVDADTETAKKDRAIIAIAASDDGLYGRMRDAEARYESLRAAVSVLEKRASIGQSLLRSLTREAGPQPAWSDAA